MNLEEVDLSLLLKEMVDNFSGFTEDPEKLTIAIQMDERLITFCDPRRIEQVSSI